jgi:hypothetical protein
MSKLNMVGVASVATPPTSEATIYIDSTSKTLKSKNDAGVVTDYAALGNAITALTGEVVASGPGSASSVVSNAAVLGKVLTGLSQGTGTVQATDTLLQAFGKLMNKGNIGFYPSATDGNATIASDTTLLRDMYYDNLTINFGATLYTNGFRIFAKTAIINNGVIDRSGLNASGTAATSGLISGTTSAGTAGGAGGAAAGAAGGTSATSLGGSGGAGGLGSGGAGGAAGTNTLNTAAAGGVETFQNVDRAREGRNLTAAVITGGAGGGGGGGDGTAGGAGGGGGGIIVIMSPSITGTGAINAKGGNGASPAGFTTGRGGGGGAGGGVIACISENDVTATSLTLSVAGGLGASGAGTGVTGSNGGVGRIYYVRL